MLVITFKIARSFQFSPAEITPSPMSDEGKHGLHSPSGHAPMRLCVPRSPANRLTRQRLHTRSEGLWVEAGQIDWEDGAVVETNRKPLQRNHCVEDFGLTFRMLAVNDHKATLGQ